MKKSLEQKVDDFLKKEKKKKEKLAAEKFFREAGSLWVKLYGELIPKVDNELAVPEFWDDGPEKRFLKMILASLRKRAEEKNIEWTKEICLQRFELFIRKSWEDRFCSGNFMLRIINMNKTKIFNNNITPKSNGGAKTQEGYTNRRNNNEAPKPTIKSKGGFGKL